MVGGPSDNSGAGAVWLFTRVAVTWGQDGGKLTANDEHGHALFGFSTASASDGNEFLVGGQADSSSLGAAWVFADEPAISAVSPSSGPTAGGTSVTIAGDNLSGASAVRFGSSAASSFRVVSAHKIDAVAPPGAAGVVDVTVTTSAGTSQAGAADTFTDLPPPSVTAVSPNSGTAAGGTQVTIVGSNLQDATSVAFGSARALFKVDDPGQITAVAPPGAAGTVDITVTSSNGTSTPSASDRFTYLPPPTSSAPPPPPPVLSHLSASHNTWREGNKLATVSRKRAKRKLPIGATYTFALNVAAAVKLEFTQRRTGRKVNGTCVAQTKRNKRKRSCVRITSAGTLTFNLASGTHKITSRVAYRARSGSPQAATPSSSRRGTPSGRARARDHSSSRSSLEPNRPCRKSLHQT